MAFGMNGTHMAEAQVPGVSAAGGAAVHAGVPVLEVNHVEKVYGSRNNVTRALADVSFAVDKGEFVGIMGASGSGKSTLLNCVSTIDTVTSGNVVINGADVTRLKHDKLTRISSRAFTTICSPMAALFPNGTSRARSSKRTASPSRRPHRSTQRPCAMFTAF